MAEPLIGRLVVIGLGLIGGSLGVALKAAGGCREVIGVARREGTGQQAVELGICNRATTSLEDVLAELEAGDVIFVAVPTLAVESVLGEMKGRLPAGVTVTDGASVKGSVVEAARAVWGEVPDFLVPGHPIAGSEKSGVTAAREDLYRDHRIILTPLDNTAEAHLQRVRAMWQAVGAEVLDMPVGEHDEVLAATSHLPHVIAYGLVDTLAHDSENENIFRYAAGGFRDFTRIASSDPVMWRDIMLANRDAILEAIDLYRGNLDTLRSAIDRGDGEYLMGVFTRAKAARDHFTKILAKKAYSEIMQAQEVTFIAQPGDTVSGTLRVPGDKSMSHRSIMLGSLAEGVTEVEGFLEGEDALATLQAFRDMGVVIEGPVDGRVVIHGVGMHGLQAPPGPLYVGNSGTSMRLLAGLLAGQEFDVTLTGDESLSKRPMNRVATPLRQMGAVIETGPEGRPPLQIKGGQPLKGIDYELPMASAQVKSCVLLAGLYAEGETSTLEPASTRDHTERMLAGFGYEVQRDGARASLRSGGSLRATKIDVPADISSATFFMVAAAIAPGSDVILEHVGINPTRDGAINILRQMGADIELDNRREVGGEPVADIRVRYAPLKGIQIPEDQVPLAIDEFPAIFVAAACAEGETVLTGAEELRVKESDRIQAMADGLKILGVNAEPTADGIVIHGAGEGAVFGGGTVDSLGDHRIAMSFAVASLRAGDTIRILNCANVATSFPNFADLAKRAGLKLQVA
ncbi:bifunctional prephenate dehydrogenase/3-phosphoshikimate 1-carboxyvinyltransferase [Microbulbifer flavimaris]|uniref:3-phosphoshikimate 1-carboxyvinyltransferase n=1 Tax=Microbulbifer flavimaris TaxID=1781068 RepID=A0ABX4I3C2_9GAMM|nr:MULTISPECIES: bifunctional prephenate dehydrogenase/3-phosphoshikimate 1-carboxyvinyltransferase [Microbulbifer]KUJ84461.1 3-phosphoshikimate 1-carboxyvinyltransferase [Microbulbifer sp. ZGT114]PCO06548.1 bifunctional prephenate dehydrogenase/3-phosphoshikimate 1-carboxyvinyltransferase [Microbulbifer flavimaris]